ncbi:MAG TPA: hypothetical protein VMS65_09480 [Polyangiaceae bacterium]|nr:hypothetical protein [Polyangiaceae bacterium]
MLARFVKAQKTPLAFDEAAATMRMALARKLDSDPARSVLSLALAKTALETSRWQALFNHDWGNVKATETYAGTYSCYACCEALPSGLTWFIPEGELDAKGGCVVGKVWLVPPGHPQTRFRAYESALDGAIAYLELFASGRYGDAWQWLQLGDAVGTVHALKRKGYFAGDEMTYARALVDLKEEFDRRLEGLRTVEVGVPNRDDVQALLAPDPDFLATVQAAEAVEEARLRDRAAPRHGSHTELIAVDAKEPSSDPSKGRVA